MKTRPSSSFLTRKQRTYSDTNDQALPCSEDLAKQKMRKKVCNHCEVDGIFEAQFLSVFVLAIMIFHLLGSFGLSVQT